MELATASKRRRRGATRLLLFVCTISCGVFVLLALLTAVLDIVVSTRTGNIVAVQDGAVLYVSGFPPARPTINARPSAFRSMRESPWRGFRVERASGMLVVRAPLWAPVLLFGVPILLLLLVRCRWGARPTMCRRCGYSLQGLTEDSSGAVTCPECGRTAAMSRRLA